MRVTTETHGNTIVTIAYANSPGLLVSLFQHPLIKKLVDHGLNAAEGHYFCTDEAVIHNAVVLHAVHNKDSDDLDLYATVGHVALNSTTYRVADADGTVMFTRLEGMLEHGNSVRAVITIEDRHAIVQAAHAAANATLVEDEDPSPEGEDNSVGTWIPSVNMLVQIKKDCTYRNRHEVYILKDIDIYDRAFILANADSARRQRDRQLGFQTHGGPLNRRAYRSDEQDYHKHGKDCIKVPFEAVEPFQLNL